jgi:hypothetical protein
VNEDPLDAVEFGSAQERVEMLLMRVNAVIREQPYQVQAAAVLASFMHGFGDGGEVREFIRRNQGVNPCDVHANDASRTNVQMANLAVAHLSIRQSDEVIGSVD